MIWSFEKVMYCFWHLDVHILLLTTFWDRADFSVAGLIWLCCLIIWIWWSDQLDMTWVDRSWTKSSWSLLLIITLDSSIYEKVMNMNVVVFLLAFHRIKNHSISSSYERDMIKILDCMQAGAFSSFGAELTTSSRF